MDIKIITGDCRILGRDVPDNSVDLVFADPPYLKEYIHLYGWLAEWSARVLKPEGFLLAYSGNYWKAAVMNHLNAHLDYFYDFVVLHAGPGSMLWNRQVVARAKSILAYQPKGQHNKPRVPALGAYNGVKWSKQYHKWGQDEGEARYYIDCFSSEGDLVMDPFIGGGTTAVVCKMLGRKFLGYEIEPESAEIARDRLNEYQRVLPGFNIEQVKMVL
jgi:site-specific DNA-methyltransferase (adenine-specific)